LDIQRIEFNTPFNPSALPAESAEKPLLFPEPEVETPKQKPSPNKSNILRDTYQDSLNWGGRRLVTGLMDTVNDKALDKFPQLKSVVNETLKEAYDVAEHKLFPNPLGYDEMLGLNDKGLNATDWKKLGVHRGSKEMWQANIKKGFGGVKSLQAIQGEVKSVQNLVSRTFIQNNLFRIWEPLREGSKGLFNSLGAGVVALFSGLNVLGKTKEGYEQEHQKELRGDQTKETTLKNTTTKFLKESFIAWAAWEACNLFFKVGTTIMSILPQTSKLAGPLKILGGIMLGSLASNITEKTTRSILESS
jgi:hypothetical protein